MPLIDELYAPEGFDEEGEFMPLITIEEEDELSIKDPYPEVLPVLALKNTVLFPGVVIPITVGRDKSIRAVQKAYDHHRIVAVLSQRDSKVENPTVDDLFDVGTLARIIKLIRMPDGTTTAILQGRRRFRLAKMVSETPYMQGTVEEINYTMPKNKLEFEAIMASITDKARNIIQLSPHIPSEAVVMIKNINNPSFLINFIASNLGVKLITKQALLEENNLAKKAESLLEQMDTELQLLELKDRIESKVRVDIEKQQRDYYLSQQLKTIQEELGGNPQEEELRALVERGKKKKWPKNAADTFEKEINKLRRMNPQVAEYAIQMNYMDVLLELPWEDFTKDNFDLNRVLKVLDKDHYGLEKVKDRILQHLAVLKLKGDMKAPILCLVGPPGVGKTSLGKSIATAIKRKFIRMSLGGLHDEAEIRGHRKTYIGAMPGRIIQSLKKAGSGNPVFILDEIDKVGQSFRGDPSSALLEVLDPEQNSTFYDNYLELEYDLSKVMFIATANSTSSIQPALLDRMEMIYINGYSTEEKIEIAKRHLIPEQLKEHGLKNNQVTLNKAVLTNLIQAYTRESGVRSLSRQIAGVMRFVAKKVAMEEAYDVKVKQEDLKEMLGPPRFSNDMYKESQPAGVAIGLAWTSVGGEILFIETSLHKGKGGLTMTGNLGSVMKESASTALSYIKAHAEDLGVDPKEIEEHDIHIHVPEGAIPKDGPSAGITMLTALTSAFTKKTVKPFLAMTGEITLRGKVLPVGGIKEKILAAKRAGIKEIILCKENQKNVEEINQDFIAGMSFHYVDRMEEVLKLAISEGKKKKG
ncbi:MAG: endopeptidase La [Saprospiraceae bacterium]|nr:endopeptidase La [Saprospiraceae bacterium]MCF8251141.1 endopeptidase La [Saprospiraceae bacterium]MCF8281864.1 endopeptidase La [Bacteroidales bacterium]MCF8312953.1 endopeptidase La [Saprospiraceae bacterium]MCF8441400.1 endopeptidase La [Saprospiraceae bacterium]